MKATFTCAACGETSPALIVEPDELDRTPRHSRAVAVGHLSMAKARLRSRGYVSIERHVCDGSGQAPASVVADLGL